VHTPWWLELAITATWTVYHVHNAVQPSTVSCRSNVDFHLLCFSQQPFWEVLFHRRSRLSAQQIHPGLCHKN